ncbi:MAG: translation initiation factor IF-2 N-terminal domain-containing protein, partial [Paramuribaculum sp.]|nr:translation initiation factor IF-2 N-terminal domain-containing protein [Paramuribaculum sp.]
MARTKISKAAKDFNVSIQTVVDFLQKKGITIDNNPNSRIDEQAYDLLVKEYQPDRELKNKSESMVTDRKGKDTPESAPEAKAEPAASAPVAEEPRQSVGPKVVGKIDLATGLPVKEET